MSIKTIQNKAELNTHIQALITIEPKFALIYKQVGVPDLRRNKGGFQQLMRAIIGQQLSVAAASSIWQKLSDANLISPSAISEADDECLKSHGLSRQKIRYIRSLAAHDIDYATLKTMRDSEVIATLTAVTGIGRWTAEMYLLFSLGRADVLAVDDLAIRVAAMQLLALTERPTPKQLQLATQPWAPYRSAASLLLWAHYGWLRQKQAIPV
ncbi:DNA-3-methyladenine glycosylase 2 family protein [Psychrobacter sp. AH5]|uniref:DNA-3-methyladenine glycosylase family protein n=1 Tax=Psychrobacter sp. AH5 TaxID=2937433 RepID=UPI003341F87F